MEARSAPQQGISAPTLLPLVASILTTGIVAALVIVPPPRPSFTMEGLLVRAALYLLLAASIHFSTVWTIWRLLREYLEPSVGMFALHLWAVVAWLPLLTILSAERSLWVACIVPWAVANALIILNLWCALEVLPDQPAIVTHPLFYVAPVPLLWKTLLPYALTVLSAEAGVVSLASARPWSAAAFFSAGVLMLLVRHPGARHRANGRRSLSRSSILQTAAVFFLITTALTPFLQRAYGLQRLSALLATVPRPSMPPSVVHPPALGYSGVVLTLPPQPHTPITPPRRADVVDLSTSIPKPVVIPFDGAYWYFKAPDTRPRPDARVQRGDPIQANIHSTDPYPIAMEAHQPLPTPVAIDCCHALRIDLLNGDTRPGAIRLEVLLRDRSGKTRSLTSLGSLPIPSSERRDIPLDRPPVPESLRFRIPESLRGRQFDEITVVVRPSAERALAGSKIAIRNFVLLP